MLKNMSTPSDECIVSVPLDFCELTDDILENTNPNLISFSLSTTSSSYNVSPTTNIITSSNVDNISENICEDNSHSPDKKSSKDVHNVYDKSCELDTSSSMDLWHLCEGRNSKSPSCVPDKSRTPQILSSGESSVEPTLQKMCFSSVISSSYPSINNHQKNLSLSLHNLNDGQCNSNSRIVRYSSQPQLNMKSSQYSNSSKTHILGNTVQKYVHVESKVKQYIQFLKKDNVKTSDNHSNSSKDNSSTVHSDESLLVHQMQFEIEKLQECLEERDIVLKEVQANHHTLLLQYAEACNRLDELRLSSVAPQSDIKCIQTEQFCKESSPKSPDHIDFEELNNEEGNGNQTMNNLLNFQQVSEISDKLETNLESRSQFDQSFTSRSETSVSGTTENCSDSQNMAYIKVAKWCTSLPTELLPVPSCYGSLGSSDIVSKRRRCSDSGDCCYGENAVSASSSNYECWCRMSFFTPCKSNKCIKYRYCTMKTINNNQYQPLAQKCCDSCTVPECNKYSSTTENNFYSGKNHSQCNVIDIPPLNLLHSVDGTETCRSDCELSVSQNEFPNTLSSVNDKCSQKDDIKPLQQRNSVMNYLDSVGTSTSYRSIFIKNNVDQEKHCIKCREHCPTEIMEQKHVKHNHSPIITTLKCEKHDKLNTAPEEDILLSKRQFHFICQCKFQENASNKEQSRFKNALEKNSKFKQLQSTQSLPVFVQYLNTVTACAQDLKKKTEALHEYLICLLKSVPNDKI